MEVGSAPHSQQPPRESRDSPPPPAHFPTAASQSLAPRKASFFPVFSHPFPSTWNSRETKISPCHPVCISIRKKSETGQVRTRKTCQSKAGVCPSGLESQQRNTKSTASFRVKFTWFVCRCSVCRKVLIMCSPGPQARFLDPEPQLLPLFLFGATQLSEPHLLRKFFPGSVNKFSQCNWQQLSKTIA